MIKVSGTGRILDCRISTYDNAQLLYITLKTGKDIFYLQYKTYEGDQFIRSFNMNDNIVFRGSLNNRKKKLRDGTVKVFTNVVLESIRKLEGVPW